MKPNLKAIRKAVRAKVATYKNSMFGRRSCTDMGGRRWLIEYAVLTWREASADWGAADWDDYSASGSQRGLFDDIAYVTENEPGAKVAVAVRLMCGDKTNEEALFAVDGSRCMKEAL